MLMCGECSGAKFFWIISDEVLHCYKLQGLMYQHRRVDSALEFVLGVWIGDVQGFNAADQFPQGTEWLDGAEGRCVLWDGGI